MFLFFIYFYYIWFIICIARQSTPRDLPTPKTSISIWQNLFLFKEIYNLIKKDKHFFYENLLDFKEVYIYIFTYIIQSYNLHLKFLLIIYLRPKKNQLKCMTYLRPYSLVWNVCYFNCNNIKGLYNINKYFKNEKISTSALPQIDHCLSGFWILEFHSKPII